MDKTLFYIYNVKLLGKSVKILMNKISFQE